MLVFPVGLWVEYILPLKNLENILKNFKRKAFFGTHLMFWRNEDFEAEAQSIYEHFCMCSWRSIPLCSPKSFPIFFRIILNTILKTDNKYKEKYVAFVVIFKSMSLNFDSHLIVILLLLSLSVLLLDAFNLLIQLMHFLLYQIPFFNDFTA